jgi:hypothetical protein
MSRTRRNVGNHRQGIKDQPPNYENFTYDERVQNALLWHSWGWNNKDCYEKAGVSKTGFKKYEAFCFNYIIFIYSNSNFVYCIICTVH